MAETHHLTKTGYVSGLVCKKKLWFDAVDPIDYAENYFALKFSLEELLKRPIDLLEQKAIQNKYLLQSINKSKRLIYEA